MEKMKPGLSPQEANPGNVPRESVAVERQGLIPRRYGLDYFMENNRNHNGLRLSTLAPHDTICIRTRNSNYRLFILDPPTGLALFQGGPHFSEPVEVTVWGSTFGGSMLKVGWIVIGSRLELFANDKTVSTSPVLSVLVERQVPAELPQVTKSLRSEVIRA